jgi:hypothetical protein
MKKTLKFLIAICCVMLLNSCTVTLLPVSVTKNSTLSEYKYVYITPTSSIISTRSKVNVNETSYGAYGSTKTETQSFNPSDVIAGYMMKKGYAQVPEIKPEYAFQTLIVNYGETGRRDIWGGLLGYTIEVTIQFLSAQTHEVVCTSTAEGMGSTKSGDIRIAINRALDEVFSLK